jgi:hypothetical protein
VSAQAEEFVKEPVALDFEYDSFSTIETDNIPASWPEYCRSSESESFALLVARPTVKHSLNGSFARCVTSA